MSADYNLFVKKNYPEPDRCIGGINIEDCLNSDIVHLIFQITSECDYIRDEWNDISFVKVNRKNLITIQNLLLSDENINNINEYSREDALIQLEYILNNCSDEDRLILEIC